MIDVLPRKFHKLSTTQIKLKRHQDHIPNYMFEIFRTSKICEATEYLINKPLYIYKMELKLATIFSIGRINSPKMKLTLLLVYTIKKIKLRIQKVFQKLMIT